MPLGKDRHGYRTHKEKRSAPHGKIFKVADQRLYASMWSLVSASSGSISQTHFTITGLYPKFTLVHFSGYERMHRPMSGTQATVLPLALAVAALTISCWHSAPRHGSISLTPAVRYLDLK